MRTNITRRFAAAIVVPVALLGLAACNDDNDDAKGSEKPNESTSQEAPGDETAVGGDTANDSESENTDASEISKDDFVKLVENGVEKTTTARMSLEIDASGVSTTAEGVMDYTGDQPATQMTMTMPGAAGAAGGGEMEIIMVDGVIYMTMPGMTQDGSYLKIDPKSDPELAKQMGGMESLDMANMTKVFTDGLEKVESAGDEEVGGVETTHYVVTVNTNAAKDMLGDLEGAETAELPDNLTYDVWLDSEGRIIQMQADMGGTGNVKMTTTDHGADVSVKAPPANKVQDMSEMMSGMSGQ